MKAKGLTLVASIAGLLAIAYPTFAHHGAAAYDMSKPVVLKDAVITQFAWINPHPLIKADYKDDKGNVQIGSWKWVARRRLSSSAGPGLR